MELFHLNIFAFIKKPIESGAFTKIFLEANEKICNKNFYFTFHYRNSPSLTLISSTASLKAFKYSLLVVVCFV